MALFNFALKAIADIQPWGGDSLHWFGLTDGLYHINVGDAQLFRYSTESLARFKKDNPELTDEPPVYVDYQVVRLYEDLLENLANVLQPVPTELHSIIADKNSAQAWQLYWQNRAGVDDETEQAEELRETASFWWLTDRHLSSSHLIYSPEINLWRYEDNIFIRWNNQHNQLDGVAVWSTQSGEYVMSVAEFMAEVTMFHNHFMATMKSRVELIATNNLIPNVKIDIAGLLSEQQARENSLANALKYAPTVKDWAAVIEANKMFLASAP
jgi:hypothetical protein